ncbi:hypothetical protein QTG54_008037 [Skeletonema marinoi]|uniref:MYND-type domain-containing protein n=1 Tax=Skeletonema marinoi TaxID=267567 RepID=A0AAD8Y9K6_9STRA|nr:hypothetical protein QTG54_008037 [Skeletonema marinoi]
MKKENDRRNLISSSDAENMVATEEQDKAARRIQFWAEKMKMERKRRRLISMLIAAEFYRVNNGLEFYDEIKEEIKEDIKEESRQAHEALYGPCRVIVVGSDRDGNGPRKGTIDCWDTIKLHLRVRINSDSTDQRPRLIKPENLDMESPGQQSAETDVKQYSVSFKFRDGSTEGGEDIRFQFNLKRRYIDELESKGGTFAALKVFREERDASTNRLDVKQEERIEKAATTEDRDRGRLAPNSQQQQQQIKSSMALMEQTSCAVTCVHGLSTSQDCSVAHEFLKSFCKECKLKADDGIALEQCIQAAIDVTYASNHRIWSNSNYMEIAISLMLYDGTKDILNGDLSNARGIAGVTNFLEQWVAISAHKTQYDWYWPKIHELCKADQHSLVSFFRNRISCKCLDEKHREVRSIKKMGICCNPRCSLPERKLERSGMQSCEQCRHVHYCSRNCQKNDWKRHKEACLGVAAKINVFDAQVAPCQLAYDDECRTSLQLQQKTREGFLAICLNTKNVEAEVKKHIEAGVAPSDAHEHERMKAKAEFEAETKQMENDLVVAEVRRTKAWNALLAAKKPKVDYSKTRSREEVRPETTN